MYSIEITKLGRAAKRLMLSRPILDEDDIAAAVRKSGALASSDVTVALFDDFRGTVFAGIHPVGQIKWVQHS